MKRFTTTLLLCSMLLLMAACGDEAKETTTSETTVDHTEETETLPEWSLPEKNWDGETVVFLLRHTEDDWSADDVLAGEINGTPVNDAVYQRNVTIEERYNVKIDGYNAPIGHSVYAPVIASVQAGDNSFDVITSYRYDAVKFMQENAVLNLNDVEYMHLEQSWWNPYYSEATSVGGKLYYALGDISRVYKLGVRCLFFNKDLAGDLGLPNLYNMVTEGVWTLDEMFSMAEQGSLDLDGDGAMKDSDRYGIQAQTSLGIVLAIGGGVQITSKDENDLPILSVENERYIDCIAKITEWLSEQENKSLYYSDVWLKTQERFSSNQALFQAEVMLLIEALRNSDVNIGILPMPKYDEAQADYISYLDSWCQNVYSIPVTSERIPIIGFVLEAMAQESVNTLTPAFYDVCLTGKYVRDEESAGMLDIIFAHTRIEDSECYGWGMYGALADAIKTGKNATSVIEARKNAEETGIAKMLSTITE